MSYLEQLIALMESLRDPQTGCGWTREQTFASLAPQTLEEAHELSDAIATGNTDKIKEELGDMLYHLIFYATIAKQQGLFTFDDLAQVMLTKQHDRLPNVSVRSEMTPEQINEHWQSKKSKKRDSILSDVSESLPATLRANKLQQRAADHRFDWPNPETVLEKLHEEVAELEHDIRGKQPLKNIESELGDVMFVMVNLCRHFGLSAEMVLHKTNQKFVRRFQHIEQQLAQQQRSLADADLAEMEALWQQAKQLEE